MGSRRFEAKCHEDGWFPEIEEVINIPMDKFIAFSTNYCVYSGFAHDVIINWVRSLFLNDKTADNK